MWSAKKILHAVVLPTALGLVSGAALSADFDGSKPLLCATFEAHGCDAGDTCLRVLPARVGLPQFLRIDFAKQAIIGPKRTTPIASIERGPGQMLLQGTELGIGWTIALDTASGRISATLVNREVAFAVFGACTPQ
jgi:hypothetical protein